MYCYNCGTKISKDQFNFCQNCGVSLNAFNKYIDNHSAGSIYLKDFYLYPIKRLDEQLKWHSKKARDNKKRFRFYQIVTIVASTSIPVINIIEIDYVELPTKIITSVIGGLIAVISGITQLEKYHENWILYRTTAELLKKEKYYFENEVGVYAGLNSEEKNKLLVENTESIVSSETSKYFVMHHKVGVKQQEEKGQT